MTETLNEKTMLAALKKLDEKLSTKITLMIGGGGAMLLAHHYPLATTDIDAFAKGIEPKELDDLVKAVAQELEIPVDWLNPYFSTFTHTLPSDYGSRLILVFSGKCITAQALSKEDLLIMKCFAHRQKDVGHVRALLKAKANTNFVFDHFDVLEKKKMPGVVQAREFLEMVIDLNEA